VTGERYRVLDDTLHVPCGGGESIVRALFMQQAERVSERDLAAMSRCTTFATLADHAPRLEGLAHDKAVALLEGLVARGLLVSEPRIEAGLHAAARAEPPPPPIALLGIPTRGRVDRAVAAVSSAVAARERPLEIVVAHDAVSPEEERALVAALTGVAHPSHVSLRYAGPAERARYAEALAERAAVDPAVVRWALSREDARLWCEGTCRNALILDAVGQLSIQLDDDIASETAASPAVEPGLALSSGSATSQMWFPAPGQGAEQLASLAPSDVPAIHERLLGRSVAACLHGAPAIDFAEASGAFLRAALAGEGRVRVTQMGIAGDSATGSLGHYLALQGSSRARLLADEATYQHAFTSRQVLRAGRRDAIIDGAFTMGFALGLDGRRLLPPFMPLHRNADGLFGIVLRRCFRDSYIGFATDVVAHRPPERRYSFAQLIRELHPIDMNDLLCRIVNAAGVESRSAEPAHGLADLGDFLQRLAALPQVELEERVRIAVLRTRTQDVANLRAVHQAFAGQPAYWGRHVEITAKALRALLLEPSHSHPRDLMAAYGEEEGRRALATTLRDYGRLLSAWPALDEAARDLRLAGVRPSRAL
jgi:hypothetical protein